MGLASAFQIHDTLESASVLSRECLFLPALLDALASRVEWALASSLGSQFLPCLLLCEHIIVISLRGSGSLVWIGR